MFGGESINWTTYFLLYSVTCCVLPMIALAVGAVIAFRRGSSFLSELIDPDVEKMQATYDELREKYPNKTTPQLVRTVIRRQSFRCGLVGALTSFGGFVTLPIALPVDMVVTYRIQGAMVNFIARAYNYDPTILQEEKAVASLVMFGSSRLTQSGMRAAREVLLEVGGKFLSKLVPFIGALIGFAMNYATTHATGELAASVYSGAVKDGTVSAVERVRNIFRGDDDDETAT